MAESKTTFELAESQDAMKLVPTWQLEWWWILVGLGALLIVVGLSFILLRKIRKTDPYQAKREAHREADGALFHLKEIQAREVAIQLSLILRRYLAKCLNDPVLFETHEEFIGRHDAIKGFDVSLRVGVSGYFAELAAIKYGPDDGVVQGGVESLKTRARELLERMYAV
jgi:hypothetical protein